MSHRYLTCLYLFLYSVFSFSQTPFIDWEFSSSLGNIHTIIPTDQGHILGGYKDGVSSIFEIDNDGIIKWEKTYTNGPGYLVKDTDGYIGASFVSYEGDYPDIVLYKYDFEGNRLWEKTYGGSGYDRTSSVIITKDGGYLLGGFTLSNDGDFQSGNQGSWDYWVIKLTKSGIIVWENTFGGSEVDELNSIVETDDGFLLIGRTYSKDGDVSNPLSDQYESDTWLIKINSNGEMIWEKTFGSTESDGGYKIISTTDGGYIFGGGLGGDCHLVKLDQFGNTVWEKLFGGSNGESIRTIQETSDGGFILAGSTFSSDGDVQSGLNGTTDGWILKVNSVGELQWEITVGNDRRDNIYSIIETNDNEFLFGGESQTNSILSGYNFFYGLVKLEEPIPLKSHDIKNIKVYPTVVDDFVKIEITNYKEIEVLIHGIKGDVVLSKKIDDYMNVVSFDHVDTGLYLLSLNSNGERIFSTRLVKR